MDLRIGCRLEAGRQSYVPLAIVPCVVGIHLIYIVGLQLLSTIPLTKFVEI